MKIRDIDLNLYILFEAIFNEGYVSKAADKVGVSHVTGSKSLMRLRACHQDELFVSTSKGMVPTVMAKSLIGPVRVALDLIRQGILEKASYNPETADNSFKISISGSSEATLIAPMVAMIQSQAPAVELQFSQHKRHQISKALRQGKLDVAVDVNFACDPEIKRLPLTSSPYVVAVRPDHPVLQQPWSLQQYLGLGHVAVSQRRLGVAQIDMELAKRKGVTRQIKLRVGNNMYMPTLLQRSNLVWTTAASHPQLSELATLPLPLPLPSLDLYLYWNQHHNENAANRWLRQQITQVAKSAS